jgi:ankyrin repeat protein
VTQTADDEITAMHWAAFHGFADMIEVLPQKGAVLAAPENNE